MNVGIHRLLLLLLRAIQSNCSRCSPEHDALPINVSELDVPGQLRQPAGLPCGTKVGAHAPPGSSTSLEGRSTGSKPVSHGSLNRRQVCQSTGWSASRPAPLASQSVSQSVSRRLTGGISRPPSRPFGQSAFAQGARGHQRTSSGDYATHRMSSLALSRCSGLSTPGACTAVHYSNVWAAPCSVVNRCTTACSGGCIMPQVGLLQ
jgi:hypothetical protein